MKDSSIKRIGRLLRLLRLHCLTGAFSARNNVRITYTHHVFEEDLENFGLLVNYAISKRNVISPESFFNSYRSGACEGKSIIFTFDDGLLSSYRAAKEILAKHNIKAIFFVPTEILELKSEDDMKDFVSKKVYFNSRKTGSFRKEEYLTMNKDQLIELHKEGHTILPHTHSHCRLSDIKDEGGIRREIILPKELLEHLLGRSVDAFAFPVGTERVISPYAYREIKRRYSFCFTGLGGINTVQTDRYFLHRDCMHANTEIKHLRNILEGSFDLYYLFKMGLLKNAAS